MPSKVMAKGPAKKSDNVQHCDVFILGSGLAGSVSGAILARQGAKVVLVDAGQHPRFAVGESMTPQLIEWLHILKSRFDVPEIGHLLNVKAVADHIGPHHGKKQNFGFIKHDAGKEPDPDEATMFVIPKVLTDASHLFRQDSDQYYFNVAAKYGCTTRQNWFATDLDFDDDGVTVTGRNGEVFRAKYLIDASGFRSPLAEKFSLREQPTRFKHHARSMFTHYIGVKPFDDVSHHPVSRRPPRSGTAAPCTTSSNAAGSGSSRSTTSRAPRTRCAPSASPWTNAPTPSPRTRRPTRNGAPSSTGTRRSSGSSWAPNGSASGSPPTGCSTPPAARSAPAGA